ncbi:MAG: phosphomannomutase/phosphoglucomutase [Gammaproteobacteria bacterium]|nr:phosphomannomutase/phosphoglucomutase [Gammaproteobacteria bacterium]
MKIKNLPSSVFRAYDIRGIVGKTLTADSVYAIGQAIGSEAHARGQQELAVARDGRLSGSELIKALKDGLRAAGRDVIDIGMTTAPMLYFAAHFLKTGSGVMLTASHNPPDYNGLKIMLGQETLSGDAIRALKTRIDNDDMESGRGGSRHMNINDAYIERITRDVCLLPGRPPFKVVIDCGNGVAGLMAPRLLRALGCEVTELYCDVDGNFPNHHPDPGKLENLQDLMEAVTSGGADLGLAFDGDGDRLGVVDANGCVIWPDRLLMLFAADVLARCPGAQIIYDIKCSRHLQTVIKQHGGKAMMWKGGHSFMKAKLKETGAPLAGEMSGHVFFKERWYGFDDALYAAARLLEILSRDKRPPAQVFAALPDAVNTPELYMEIPEERKFPFMQQFIERAQFTDAELTAIDGLRVDFANGWGLLRPSNTTPCLTLRFEANDEAALTAIQAQFRKELLALDNTLKLPF